MLRSMRISRFAAAALLLAACGSKPEPNDQAQTTTTPIIGGQSESQYPAVMCLQTVPGGGNPSLGPCDCSGALISPSYVLTAKHCGSITRVVPVGSCGSALGCPLGSLVVDNSTPFYPGDSDVTEHDLQLLHLASPYYDVIPLHINTAPLPGVGQSCVSVGFGFDATQSSGNEGLKRSATVTVTFVGAVTTTLTDFITLNTTLASSIQVTAGSAGSQPPPGTPAEGDSGGPLLCNGNVVGAFSGYFNTDPSKVYYTAVDSTCPTQNLLQAPASCPRSAAWIANQTADSVSEPMVSAITGGPNVMDLFVRGTDGQVYHKWSDGQNWGPSTFGWQGLGGYIMGTPEAVTWGGNRIDVFVRGSDLALWQLAWDGSQWSWAQRGGGPFIGHPSAVSWAPNRLAIFAVDAGGNLDYIFWNGSTWSNWAVYSEFDNSPVQFAGPVKAVIMPFNGVNYVDVFAVGADHVLYDAADFFDDNSGPGDSAWESLGGNIVGRPSVVSWGPNRMDVFVKQADNAIYHKAWDPSLPLSPDGFWHPSAAGTWESQYGSMTAAPVASSYASGKLTVIAPGSGTDGLDYKAWFGVSWVPSQTTWDALGTVPVGTPTLLPFPSAGTIDMFTVGPDFTPSIMQYDSKNGPPISYGWFAPGSMGGTVSPW